jgi:hypothetical protein
MLEFQIGDHSYRARKLNTFQQMHMLRRIGPLIGPMFGAPETEGRRVAAFLEALGKMTDDDCDFVIKTCASAVQRLQGSNGAAVWADIYNPRASTFMFEDIDNLATMLQITGQILQDNLSGFLSIRLPESEMEQVSPQAPL